ncbi:MAG: hypothetical protein ACPGSM_06225 [Thiolinea sp.]
MKKKVTLLAGALMLVFSASAAQAHGSLFGVFFKNHKHYACGHHYNDHGPHEVYHHVKHKHYGHHHYGVHKEKKLIW